MQKQIAKQIKKAQNIAVFGHIRPDGDAISSSYGLLNAIKLKWPDKNVVWVGDKEYVEKNFGTWGIDTSVMVSEIDDTYLTIVGDTSGSDRVDGIEQYNKGYFKICFDHHRNDSDLNADIFWHEPTWTASSMQSFLIAKQFKVKLTEHAALFLAIGILTDTGFFKYSLADSQPLTMFAELVNSISNERLSEFYNKMSSRTQADLEIQKYILNNVVYDGRVAYVLWDKAAVKKFGRRDISIKVNVLSNIEGFPIWAFFLDKRGEPSDTSDLEMPWSISMRSNGPDVQAVAKEFDGGGHIRAAGAKAKTKADLTKVLKMLNKK